MAYPQLEVLQRSFVRGDVRPYRSGKLWAAPTPVEEGGGHFYRMHCKFGVPIEVLAVLNKAPLHNQCSKLASILQNVKRLVNGCNSRRIAFMTLQKQKNKKHTKCTVLRTSGFGRNQNYLSYDNESAFWRSTFGVHASLVKSGLEKRQCCFLVPSPVT